MKKKTVFAITVGVLAAAVYLRHVFFKGELPSEPPPAICHADTLSAKPQPQPLPYGLVRIRDMDTSILVDLKYATTDNFTGKILYPCAEAYLQRETAEKLYAAGQYLQSLHPDLRLLVYDAARPLSIQQKMWDAVKNTPYRKYVADPERTSLHNYGAAVDLTLSGRNGKPLDMGTAFDHFGEAASTVREDELLRRGRLTEQQVSNRKLLREVMQKAGFQSISGEWWHFNSCTLAEARRRYPLLSGRDPLLVNNTASLPDTLPAMENSRQQ
ncbi:MAG: M15 family metallopeptidase [Bacteroidales bacterium]|jgi:D-alanyl-D-alanine dipeptidase|nr:M15 family metallopeptidase [Bacteroidales bacterium]